MQIFWIKSRAFWAFILCKAFPVIFPIVTHFSGIDLKVKYLNMLSSHSTNFVHKVIVQTVSGLIQLVSRFIITIFRRQKFLRLFFVVRAFYCLILLAANLSLCFCVQTLRKRACGTPTFFCVDRFLWIKRFSPFILKHVAILDFVCVKDLMVFSLRFECFVPKKLFVL